jgi:hypothetical protein
MLWCFAAREARASQIESSPKKMDGADFAAEAGTEPCEDARRLQQNTPESLRKFRVIGVVNLILVKTNPVLDLDWHGPDTHRQVEAIECGDDPMIEIRDRHGPEWERPAGAIAGIDEELVADEIEIYLQHPYAVGHGQRGEAADGGIEGDVPRVVDIRHKGEANLSHDLEPKLERGAGIAPLSLGKWRPNL